MEITYFAIIIGAIFVNNVVLAQFLGICRRSRPPWVWGRP